MVKLRKNRKHQDIDLLDILKEPLRVNEQWTKDEHEAFARAALKYGKDYQQILQDIGTKTRD